jgi:hypothetical protein
MCHAEECFFGAHSRIDEDASSVPLENHRVSFASACKNNAAHCLNYSLCVRISVCNPHTTPHTCPEMHERLENEKKFLKKYRKNQFFGLSASYSARTGAIVLVDMERRTRVVSFRQ